jgi:hypothetical protein
MPKPNPVRHEGTDNCERAHAKPKAVWLHETVIMDHHDAERRWQRDQECLDESSNPRHTRPRVSPSSLAPQTLGERRHRLLAAGSTIT